MMKAYAKWKFPTMEQAKKAVEDLEFSIFSWGWNNENTDADYQCDGFEKEDGVVSFAEENGEVIVTWEMTCENQIKDLEDGDTLWASPAPLGEDEIESHDFHIEQE